MNTPENEPEKTVCICGMTGWSTYKGLPWCGSQFCMQDIDDYIRVNQKIGVDPGEDRTNDS